MKRLALLLGSLLVVSAAASAKEVVPAPVVVEEAPVQIVEKEVIVYRDKEEGFRPNGSLHLDYKYYGETEGQDFTTDTYSDAWNGGNNYSRMELSGVMNMTEKQRLEYRVRDYENLQGDSAKQTDNGTDTRLRYYYNHGDLASTKIGLESRVEYYNHYDSQYQDLVYQARFDFGGYLFDNDYIKTDYFKVVPKVGYSWGDSNSDDYYTSYGVDFETKHILPYGFDIELNVYNTFNDYGVTHGFDANGDLQLADGNPFTKNDLKDTYDDSFTTKVELYLHYNKVLYTNEKWTVALGTEWGYDPYTVEDNTTDKRAYYLKADQWITTTYAITDTYSVFGTVGAEYGNFAVKSESSATNWRWQPYVTVGFDVAF